MISSALREWLRVESGIELGPGSGRSVSGGCINEGTLAETAAGELVFLKRNESTNLPLFEAEKQSLELLGATKAIRVPKPFCLGIVDGRAVFAMEGIVLANCTDDASQERLGRELATLHRTLSPDGRFGASFDNHIGATPQPNSWTESWADFFVTHRLEHQFRIAEAHGKSFPDAPALLEAVHPYLSQLNVEASLLHGDLWGGNVSFDESGNPVLYDPASYYGDREADLAFTHMFGGFGPGFYAAYRREFPEVEPVRETIYNLYHLLNHFNLFGGGYAAQASQAMRDILSGLG